MRDTILIADDKAVNRKMLAKLFDADYKILEASDGQQCMDTILQHQDEIAMILLDLQMPNKHGFEVMMELNTQHLPDKIPVIMVTGLLEEKLESQGFELGVTDYITKPFVASTVRKRVNNVIALFRKRSEMRQLIETQTQKMQQQKLAALHRTEKLADVLSSLVEFREVGAGKHPTRVRLFALELAGAVSRRHAKLLPAENVEWVAFAASVHDVGKVMLPDSIILKPGKLTEEEFDMLKSHTTMGAEVVESLVDVKNKALLSVCKSVCLHHHERWDGSGYPDGLKGDEIPIEAQIVTVADVYDALISERNYKEAIESAEAYRMIVKGDCGAFSELMMECLTEMKTRFEEIAKEYAD